MKTIATLFLCWLIIFPVFAQNTLTVAGKVHDASTQEPLTGANVYAQSRWQNGTSTDENGQFTFTLAEGDSLVVTFVGYQAQTLPVPTSEASWVIALQPFLQNMEEVTVQATRLVAEEFTIKTIRPMDIYTNPSAKGDPLLAVNALPASTTLDESASISLRGSSPAETGIFLNDVPIYDAVRFAQLNGIGTFSIFNTNVIRQLQVFPSNPPLEFGNISAGLISLSTVEHIPKEAKGSIALSPANLGGYASLPTGASSALVLFSNYQPSGPIQALNSRALQDLKSFSTLDFGVNFVQKWERSQLKVFNYAVREGYQFASRHPSGNGIFRQRKQRNFTVAQYQFQYDHALLTTSGGFSASRMQFAVGNLDIHQTNQDIYFSTNYTRFRNAWTFKTGITYDHRRQTTHGQYPVYNYARAPYHPFRRYSVSPLRGIVSETYLYTKYQPNERWTLGAGVRKNLSLENQENYWSGQFNTHYQLNPQQTLTLSAGRYHQYTLPQAEETAIFYKSHQLALDYQYENARYRMDAAVFAKRTQNGVRTNRVYGAEMSLRAQWTKKLSTQTSYTYLNATVQESERQYDSPYNLNYFVRANATYQLSPQWTLNAILLHRQGTFYQPVIDRQWDQSLQVYEPTFAPLEETQRLPDYSTLDLSVSRLWPVFDRWTAVAFASVNNALNHENVRAINYTQDYQSSFHELFSQRTVYFGVVLQFQ